DASRPGTAPVVRVALRNARQLDSVLVPKEGTQQPPSRSIGHTVDNVLNGNLVACITRPHGRDALRHDAEIFKLHLRVFAVEQRVCDFVTSNTDRFGNVGVGTSRELKLLGRLLLTDVFVRSMRVVLEQLVDGVLAAFEVQRVDDSRRGPESLRSISRGRTGPGRLVPSSVEV